MTDQLALTLPIAPADIAAATLARHRRMATANGADPAVVDSPAYRALLSRHASTDVAAYITGSKP